MGKGSMRMTPQSGRQALASWANESGCDGRSSMELIVNTTGLSLNLSSGDRKVDFVDTESYQLSSGLEQTRTNQDLFDVDELGKVVAVKLSGLTGHADKERLHCQADLGSRVIRGGLGRVWWRERKMDSSDALSTRRISALDGRNSLDFREKEGNNNKQKPMS
jgi:hypothetical protein